MVAPPMDRKRTPLYDVHKSLGARLIDFGGWDMPVQYAAGTIKEHKAVREAVGLFDVSHMGEAVLRGPNARDVVDRLCSNNVAGAPVGKAVYTLLCRPDGGIVDDCIFYKRADDQYFVIINAGNTAKDIGWMREHTGVGCDLDDVSDNTALIAVQGPKAVAMVDNLTDIRVAELPSFTFATALIGGVECMVARTGYTGEDGFEIAVPNAVAAELWNALLETGAGDVVACGLAARDTLRLEAGMPLYGHELGIDWRPEQAGLGRVVAMSKPENFVGKAALEQPIDANAPVLVGLASEGKRAGRAGYQVMRGDEVVGEITSGALSPTLGFPIAMALVHPSAAEVGTELELDVRGSRIAARVVALPFYRRS